MRQKLNRGNEMAPKYEQGQQVVIRSVKNQDLSQREFDLEPYAGQRGVVRDYYWISLERGVRFFYIYTIQIGVGKEEIVLHEDEIKS